MQRAGLREKFRQIVWLVSACSACASFGAAFADDRAPPAAPGNPAAAQELQQVTVIGNTPLPGLGLPLNQIPANVQTATSADMLRQQSLDLTDYLNNNFSGINVSASADNAFQTDINYHGFTASPLLGTPQGLSVYVDGVRVNESFGDTVNWDLIPESAISNVTFMSGSNPVFGLNTLGGALSVHTKSGHENPGTQLQIYGGSFGRRAFELESGGEWGHFDYFFTGNYFDESGWRDLSPSKVYQGFGKVGWQNDETDLDLSYTYADSSLFGNGATPLSMLDFRRAASYTPDFTQNILNLINLTGTQFLSEHLLLSANAYYRHLRTGSANGNINDNYLSDDYSGPSIDCAIPAGSRTALSYCSAGQNATSQLVQRTKGFALQLTDTQDLFGWKNQAIFGADYNESGDIFAQEFQYGPLNPDRTLVDEPSPFNNETVIALSGSNKILGTYLTDTISPNDLLHFAFSVRYNRNTEMLHGFSVDSDVGDAGSGFDESSPLTGNHSFSRTNPAFGFTVTPSETLTFYADYNEASRAPTVIELGCADPKAPCGLPNDFASDPDLRQVVARTVEIGARSVPADQRFVWSADVFHTVNTDDIQFVAATTNQGFFDNVGNTRRQGFDVAVGGKEGGLNWHIAYSFVDATFQSSFEVSAESNSTADADGDISIRPGDRIPLIPRHTGRLVLDYDFNSRLNLGGSLVAASGAFLHGNENNANQAGASNGESAFISGSGSIPGYAVINLQSTYRVSKHAEFFARLVNVLNRQYATAGFLTNSSFNSNGSFRADPNDWTNENAVSPAQPRAIWVGMRVRWE